MLYFLMNSLIKKKKKKLKKLFKKKIQRFHFIRTIKNNLNVFVKKSNVFTKKQTILSNNIKKTFKIKIIKML